MFDTQFLLLARLAVALSRNLVNRSLSDKLEIATWAWAPAEHPSLPLPE